MFAVPLAKAALLGGVARTPAHILGFNLKVWHDVQDLSTMFADFVGTPATVGSSVALQLDKSQGGALGSDIKATGTPAITGTATAATYNTSTGAGTVSTVDGSNFSAVTFSGVTVGQPYLVDIQNTGAASLSLIDSGITLTVAAGQRQTIFMRALVASLRIVAVGNGNTASFTVHSVREVLGTPRYQTTAAQRPILGRHPMGGQRNLLLQIEDCTVSPWGATVFGTSTRSNVAGSNGFGLLQAIATASNGGLRQLRTGLTSTQVYTLSFYLESAASSVTLVLENGLTGFGAGHAATITPSTGVISSVNGFTSTSSEPLGSGYLYTFVTAAAGGLLQAAIEWRIPTNGDTIKIGRPQFEAGSVRTACQKVTTRYDCTETGVPDCYYLQADGSDDGMVTPALDLTTTDKIGVFAAVRKLSDALRGAVVGLSSAPNANNGAFELLAPGADATADYRFIPRGTTTASAVSATVAAPNTAILTGVSDIAGDIATIRTNGAAQTSATDQGTGNYGNYALYFFRRGGTTLPFNGLEYGFALCDTTPSAAQIAAMETHYNNIVGVY